MTIKQSIGVLMILTVIATTLLSVLGIWGVLSGEVAVQLVITLVVVAGGLGVSAAMLDRFFKDES